jgi:hypothetical protein
VPYTPSALGIGQERWVRIAVEKLFHHLPKARRIVRPEGIRLFLSVLSRNGISEALEGIYTDNAEHPSSPDWQKDWGARRSRDGDRGRDGV